MSYALSLSFFEAAPLIALRRTGCRSVTLLSDTEGYRVSVSEAGVNQVGRTYELGPVSVDKGIFHPKIMLLTGPNGPRAAIGSGNLTFNGWGGNLEMLDYLAPAAAAQALGDLGSFLEAVQNTPRVQAVWPNMDPFIDACRVATRRDSDGQIRVIHSLSRTIADQLVDAANDLGGAVSITFVSPFFKSVGAIAGLVKKLKTSDVSVLVPAVTPEYFPFSEADAAGLKVKPVTAPIFSAERRRLHAKIIEIVCRRGRLLLSGSVNATGPALIETNNVEVGVLRFLKTAELFGWKAIKRPKGPGVGGPMPSQSSSSVLIAHFDGASISGQIFGVKNLAPNWKATIVDDDGQKELVQIVNVSSDGAFNFRLSSASHDIWGGRSALRLILRSGAREVSGWVMLAPYLFAIRQHGPVVESIIRLVSGSEDQTDIETILGFFTENPQSLLSMASRGKPSSAAGAPVAIEGNVDPSDLVPISREAATQGGRSGGERTAFEQLLERLREYVASNPHPEKQIDEEEEDEEEPGDKSSRKARKKSARKIPHEDFYRLVDAFVERIEGRPESDIARRSDLLTLLDLGLFFSARAEEPFNLRVEFLNQWTELAFRLTKLSDHPDELERSLLLVLLTGVISGRDQPVAALAALQRRLGGAATPSWMEAVAPDHTSRRALALIADAVHESWLEAFMRVGSSRTPWMDAMEAWTAITAGIEIPAHNALLREPEADMLRAMASKESEIAIQKVSGKAGRPYCPRCHMTLPAIQAWRLRTQHIASAASCCNRILLDLEP